MAHGPLTWTSTTKWVTSFTISAAAYETHMAQPAFVYCQEREYGLLRAEASAHADLAMVRKACRSRPASNPIHSCSDAIVGFAFFLQAPKYTRDSYVTFATVDGISHQNKTRL
ncbi:hypothetical protein ACJQWK_05140 [Exserohilum turcicum]